MQKVRHSAVYARSLSGQPASPEKEKMLTVPQVANRLSCAKSHVYNLLTEGKLDYVTLGQRNGKRVPESVLVKFIAARKAEAGA